MSECFTKGPIGPTTLSPEQASRLSEFAIDAVATVKPTTYLTGEQAFSLLVGFSGVDNPERQKTYTFVYTDPETGKSNYQTACVPEHAAETPFTLTINDEDKSAKIIHKSDGPTHDVKIHAVIGVATNHHYSRVDKDFNVLPTAIISSPRSTCAAGCPGCSRGAVGFSAPSKDYISEHVEEVKRDYDEHGWDPQDLASVNITTGSQPSEEKEVEMMVDIIEKYRQLGFTNARFMIYNYAIQSEIAMRKIRSAGADGYIGTIETMNDELRRKNWGPIKGSQSFEDHLARYALAHRVGFPIVETNYVVGIDPFDEMMDGIKKLDSEGVAVVPNIMRSYNPRQFAEIHPDVWAHGFEYVLNAFDACLRSYRNPTIKAFAGEKSVEWLVQKGLEPLGTTYRELPVRHT